MADSNDSITMEILKDIREDISGLRSDILNLRLGQNEIRSEMQAGFHTVNRRIDGVVQAIKGSYIEMTDLRTVVNDLSQRVEKLENM